MGASPRKTNLCLYAWVAFAALGNTPSVWAQDSPACMAVKASALLEFERTKSERADQYKYWLKIRELSVSTAKLANDVISNLSDETRKEIQAYRAHKTNDFNSVFAKIRGDLASFRGQVNAAEGIGGQCTVAYEYSDEDCLNDVRKRQAHSYNQGRIERRRPVPNKKTLTALGEEGMKAFEDSIRKCTKRTQLPMDGPNEIWAISGSERTRFLCPANRVLPELVEELAPGRWSSSVTYVTGSYKTFIHICYGKANTLEDNTSSLDSRSCIGVTLADLANQRHFSEKEVAQKNMPQPPLMEEFIARRARKSGLCQQEHSLDETSANGPTAASGASEKALDESLPAPTRAGAQTAASAGT